MFMDSRANKIVTPTDSFFQFLGYGYQFPQNIIKKYFYETIQSTLWFKSMTHGDAKWKYKVVAMQWLYSVRKPTKRKSITRSQSLRNNHNIQLRETSLAIFEFLLKKFPPVAYAFNNGLSTSSAADAILNSHWLRIHWELCTVKQ